MRGNLGEDCLYFIDKAIQQYKFAKPYYSLTTLNFVKNNGVDDSLTFSLPETVDRNDGDVVDENQVALNETTVENEMDHDRSISRISINDRAGYCIIAFSFEINLRLFNSNISVTKFKSII